MKTFRVGVMTSGLTFTIWEAEAIKALAEIPEVQIALLIFEGQRRLQPPQPPVPAWKRLWRAISDGTLWNKLIHRMNWLESKSLWTRYSQWQRSRHRIAALEEVDLSWLLAGVPTLTCNTYAKGRFAETFSDLDVLEVRDHRLDAILKFGFNIVHGDILQAARHGIWSYHHDDHLRYRGGPPGFWEVFQQDPWTGAMLQRINEKLDDGRVLHKEYFRTMLHSYSYNVDRIWTGSACWPALAALNCLSQPDAEEVGVPSPPSSAPIYRRPTNAQMLSFATTVLKGKLHERLSPGGPLKEHWALGTFQTDVQDFLASAETPPIQWLCTEAGTFAADPFVVHKDGQDYLFFEKFDFRSGLGRIEATSTLDWHQFSPTTTVLGNPQQHFSYPMVFGWQDGYFAIPEQHQQNEVALYELTNFPAGWRKVAVILDQFAGLDPTIFFDGEFWWLLIGGPDLKVDRLFAFYATKPTGPWKPHASNPIIQTAARRSRPGGGIFSHQGQYYRPAQYGYRYYGYGLLVYRIDELTPTSYRESLVKIQVPQPNWNFADGTHHLCRAGNRWIMDGKNHFRGSAPAASAEAICLEPG